MSDIPSAVRISEEGPREGFQIEKGPIATARKIELIDALSGTGIDHMQIVSFVNPKAVPGMADADDVVEGIKINPDVAYTALWLNERGFERALQHDRLTLGGSITLVGSEKFSKRNQNRGAAEQLASQHAIVEKYKASGIPVERGMVMAAFGCNFEGDVPVARGAADSRRRQGARRHAEICLARRHHGVGQSARHQARRRRLARALARCRFRAASA
jgi:hydroxymethylglutaryl-CoA lyase